MELCRGVGGFFSKPLQLQSEKTRQLLRNKDIAGGVPLQGNVSFSARIKEVESDLQARTAALDELGNRLEEIRNVYVAKAQEAEGLRGTPDTACQSNCYRGYH